MKRYIIVISMLLVTLLSADGFKGFGNLPKKSSFMKPSEAFKVKATSTKDGLNIDISLGNKIHIYKNKLKATIVEPIKKELNLNLPKGKIITGEEAYEGNLTLKIPNSKLGVNGDYKLQVDLMGCSDEGICYSPQRYEFNLTQSSKVANSTVANNKESSTQSKSFFSKISDLAKSGNSKQIVEALKSEGIVFILLLFFIVGLLLALTPCILPMVPILSSIIIKQAGKSEDGISKRESFTISLVYVVAMALAYSLIGVVAGLLNFDLQANANNPFVIIPIALIFVALAFSLFGYYELALPSSLQTKLNNISNNAQGKGYVGTAIMGAISALVVGACTAPVISGAIIFISITGDAVLGGLALFVMGLGAGVPLLLIGLGANKFVPKPGGWMENVSKFFGFLMLVMALYVARGVISDTTFIYVLSILLIGAGLLFGALDEKKSIFKVITFLMLIYGVILFIGAVAGAKSTLKPLEPFTSKVATKAVEPKEEKAKSYTLNELLNEIKNAKKPVVIDIGKDNCAACTELAEITFPNKKVKNELNRFKFIKLDITDYTQDDKDIMKHFKLFGAPNILIFNSKGEAQEDKFLQGFIEPERFVEILKNVK